MGPVGTIAAQLSVVTALLWAFGAFGELLLPPTIGLLTVLPVLGALTVAPRSLIMQLPVSFSVVGIVSIVVASIAWSIAPEASLINVRGFVPPIIAVVLAAGILTQRDFMDAMIWTVRLAIVVTIIALVIHPSTRTHTQGGVDGRLYPGWHGWFIHKNQLAPFLAMSIPTVLVFDRNALTRWATMGVIGLLLVGSTSATGISGAFVAGVTWGWLRTYQHQADDRDSTLLFSFSLLGMLAAIGGAVASFATITSAYGKDTTLSGRTDIWAASIEALLERPWLGYGYGGLFWTLDVSSETARIWRQVGFEASHAHNGALDLALQIGLIGLTVFLVLWLSVLRGAWRRISSSPDLSVWILSIMAANFVIGLTEDVFLGGWLALFVAMRVLLLRRESSLLQPPWWDGIAKWN